MEAPVNLTWMSMLSATDEPRESLLLNMVRKVARIVHERIQELMGSMFLQAGEFLDLCTRADDPSHDAAVLSEAFAVGHERKGVRVAYVLSGLSLNTVRIDGTALVEEVGSNFDRVYDDHRPSHHRDLHKSAW